MYPYRVSIWCMGARWSAPVKPSTVSEFPGRIPPLGLFVGKVFSLLGMAPSLMGALFDFDRVRDLQRGSCLVEPRDRSCSIRGVGSLPYLVFSMPHVNAPRRSSFICCQFSALPVVAREPWLRPSSFPIITIDFVVLCWPGWSTDQP